MRVRLALAGVIVGTTIGVAVSRMQQWRRSWGIDPNEATRGLAGDAVVPNPVASETRGITIDASPEHVWPWLVQMGFGKAGWYSYDRLDMRGRSADGIVDVWQTLKVGDIVPTHPGGGFEVVEIDPGRSLVLRSDTALVTSQSEAWAKRQAAEHDVPARTSRSSRRPPVSRRPAPSWARRHSSSRRAGCSSSSRSVAGVPPHRAIPRLVRRIRDGVPCRDAGRRVRGLRDAPEADGGDQDPSRASRSRAIGPGRSRPAGTADRHREPMAPRRTAMTRQPKSRISRQRPSTERIARARGSLDGGRMP